MRELRETGACNAKPSCKVACEQFVKRAEPSDGWTVCVNCLHTRQSHEVGVVAGSKARR